MDLRKVKKLMELLEGSPGISEIAISKKGEGSIRISREPSKPASPSAAYYAPITPPSGQMPGTALESPTGQTQQITTSIPAANEHAVAAPMVGTFYRAASPNDKPFAEVGQSVKIGTVLCIVEAMKMLNQIEADKAGIIKRICVENGQPVEFGQPLFIISDD